MQSIERDRWLPFTLEATYATLTDVDKFAQIVKRIDALEVLERAGQNGRVNAVIDLPGGKLIETQGAVEGEENQFLQFKSEEPFPMIIRWELKAETQGEISGTLVHYHVQLDLSSILAVMPTMILNGFLSAEMEGDLTRLNDMLAGGSAQA